jgi:hypothetical protein
MKPTLRDVAESIDKVYRDPSGFGPMVWRADDGSFRVKVPAAAVDRIRYMVTFDFPDAEVEVS